MQTAVCGIWQFGLVCHCNTEVTVGWCLRPSYSDLANARGVSADLSTSSQPRQARGDVSVSLTERVRNMLGIRENEIKDGYGRLPWLR